MCPLHTEEFGATNTGHHYVLCLLQGKAGASVASPPQDEGYGADVEDPDRHVRDLHGYQPPLFVALYYILHMYLSLMGSKVFCSL